jgi:glycosyltransferase involved in cell wall biosynthesis
METDAGELLRFGALQRSEPDYPRLVARTERAEEILDWRAVTALEDGLDGCFEWYRSEADNPWRARAGREVPFSLVMPCYNEEASLPGSIPPLSEVLAKQGLACEIVLVNNGSTDRTAEVIDELAARGLPVTRVDVERNEGYGHGILTGLKAARGRYRGFMCADGQIAPEDVARLLWAVQRAGPGALVKVRRLTRSDGLFRWFQSRMFNLLCLVLFRTLTTDVNGTPKMMERRVWERMDLCSKDWFIDAEVMLKSRRLGLDLVEVPVEFMPRQAGRSWVNLGTTLEFLANMTRALFRRW